MIAFRFPLPCYIITLHHGGRNGVIAVVFRGQLPPTSHSLMLFSDVTDVAATETEGLENTKFFSLSKLKFLIEQIVLRYSTVSHIVSLWKIRFYFLLSI